VAFSTRTKWYVFVVLPSLLGLSGCGSGTQGGCDYFTGECHEPDYGVIYEESPEVDPYPDNYDRYDLDCEDVGEKVWVGDDDPNGLDRDGDGWGCETYP
jgi:hypothetical protein